MDYFVQGIGIVAMALLIFSFQLKTKKRILTVQFFSSILFMIHFGLIGAITGSILNGIGALRALVITSRPKKWAMCKAWVPFFFVCYVAAYAMTFLVFDKEPTVGNLLLELLPVAGMIITTFAFLSETEKRVRRLSLINSPLWLAYNGINGSIGGTLVEAFSLVSILIAIYRYDIRGEKKKAE
ncbi:MAG: YgjV family protein [Clostridia bacterium]|nr:YgjV family protein [Clostridia bacterium]